MYASNRETGSAQAPLAQDTEYNSFRATCGRGAVSRPLQQIGGRLGWTCALARGFFAGGLHEVQQASAVILGTCQLVFPSRLLVC